MYSIRHPRHPSNLLSKMWHNIHCFAGDLVVTYLLTPLSTLLIYIFPYSFFCLALNPSLLPNALSSSHLPLQLQLLV